MLKITALEQNWNENTGLLICSLLVFFSWFQIHLGFILCPYCVCWLRYHELLPKDQIHHKSRLKYYGEEMLADGCHQYWYHIHSKPKTHSKVLVFIRIKSSFQLRQMQFVCCFYVNNYIAVAYSKCLYTKLRFKLILISFKDFGT